MVLPSVNYFLLVLHEALLADAKTQGTSQVANIVLGKVKRICKYYICHKTLTKSCVLSYK